jgi:hypothetical protein
MHLPIRLLFWSCVGRAEPDLLPPPCGKRLLYKSLSAPWGVRQMFWWGTTIQRGVGHNYHAGGQKCPYRVSNCGPMYNRSRTSLPVSTIFQVDPFRICNDHCIAEMHSPCHSVNEFNHMLPAVTKNREFWELHAPAFQKPLLANVYGFHSRFFKICSSLFSHCLISFYINIYSWYNIFR